MAGRKKAVILKEVISVSDNSYYNLPVSKKKLAKYLVNHSIIIDEQVFTSKEIMRLAYTSSFSTNAVGLIWKETL